MWSWTIEKISIIGQNLPRPFGLGDPMGFWPTGNRAVAILSTFFRNYHLPHPSVSSCSLRSQSAIRGLLRITGKSSGDSSRNSALVNRQQSKWGAPYVGIEYISHFSHVRG